MRFMYRYFFAGLILFCIFSNAVQAAELENITLGVHTDKTRLVFRLDAPVKYSISNADNILILRLRKTNAVAGITRPAAAGALSKLRLEAQGDDTLITIELKPQQTLKTHFLLSDAGAPPRVVLDFVKGKSASAKKPAAKNAAATNSFPDNPAAPPRRKPVIVLDPGHGGDDPGAIGASGLKEKDVTLMMARELKAAFEESGAYTVYLTRSDDRFIPLRQRTRIAQNYNADLFISIHADAHTSRRAQGGSVYTLSERASDKEAEALANKENRADIIHGVDLSNTSGEVSSILIDLVQRETMNLSSQYATMLVNNLKNSVNLKKDTHRFAGFMVLKAPDTPAILLELGFLSNPKEEWLLKQRSHRAKIVRGIVKTTNSFFRVNSVRDEAREE